MCAMRFALFLLAIGFSLIWCAIVFAVREIWPKMALFEHYGAVGFCFVMLAVVVMCWSALYWLIYEVKE